MSRESKYISIEGQFEKDVLGIFKIIRGFADLRDLARMSVPYEMEYDEDTGHAAGHQREIDEEHAQRIKQYLEEADHRFIPEVVLSIRTDIEEIRDGEAVLGVRSSMKDGIYIRRRWQSKNIRVHSVSVQISMLKEIRTQKRIRRIDGNHRLRYAEDLTEDAMVPSKYLAPFCLVLLNPPGDGNDDYAESLIFHTINSTALPLDSEHALRLILGQDSAHAMRPEREFAYSPELHFTRLLRDAVAGLPQPARERLGDKPLTVLYDAARCLTELEPTLKSNLDELVRYRDDLFGALADILPRVHAIHPDLCKKNYFIELVARVWKAVDAGEQQQKVDQTVILLEKFGNWIRRIGMERLEGTKTLSEQLLKYFSVIQNRIPKRIFLARWYPKPEDGDHENIANLRLNGIRRALDMVKDETGKELECIDMGTQEGGTFPIHSQMYNAIASSDIILVDLTGLRPNVCVEAGYALKHHEQGRLLFMHQEGLELPDGKTSIVPFDLNDFRYEPFRDTGEIPDKLKANIVEILKLAEEGL